MLVFYRHRQLCHTELDFRELDSCQVLSGFSYNLQELAFEFLDLPVDIGFQGLELDIGWLCNDAAKVSFCGCHRTALLVVTWSGRGSGSGCQSRVLACGCG